MLFFPVFPFLSQTKQEWCLSIVRVGVHLKTQCSLTHAHYISLPDFLLSFACIVACRLLSEGLYFACVLVHRSAYYAVVFCLCLFLALATLHALLQTFVLVHAGLDCHHHPCILAYLSSPAPTPSHYPLWQAHNGQLLVMNTHHSRSHITRAALPHSSLSIQRVLTKPTTAPSALTQVCSQL